MKKWEYICAYYALNTDNTSTLNQLGMQGWELIQVIQSSGGTNAPRWIFKREKIEVVKPVNDD